MRAHADERVGKEEEEEEEVAHFLGGLNSDQDFVTPMDRNGLPPPMPPPPRCNDDNDDNDDDGDGTWKTNDATGEPEREGEEVILEQEEDQGQQKRKQLRAGRQ